MTEIQRRAFLLAAPALLLGRAALAQRRTPRPAEIIQHPRVETFDMRGAEGADPWRIFIGRPAQPAPSGGYPAIFLLDGNATFPLAWHAQERACARGCAAPALLVGIGYPVNERFDVQRRFYDLTSETPAEYLQGRAGTTRTGGQDAFLAFIIGKLREEVARRMPVDARQQALFGHSLGGLCVLHALFTRPEQFGTYIAADPSIWWNNRSILQEQAAFLAGVRAAGGQLSSTIRLLIENSGMRRLLPAGTRPATVTSRMGGPGGRETAMALKTIGGLALRYRRFEQETHGSMLPGSVQDALSFFQGDDIGEAL